MRWWRRAVRAFRAPTAAFDSAPRPVDRLIMEMLGRTGEARPVSRTQAMSVPGVQRARNTLCSIATLPLVQYAPDLSAVRNPLLEQIDPDVTNVVTLAQTVEDLLFDSIAWWRVLVTDAAGYPTFARRLDPCTVSLDPPKDRPAAPLPSGYDPRQPYVWVDGKRTPAKEMIRFDSPNPAVLVVAARAIRKAILLDKAAAMYADDPRPLDYFTPADGADPASDDDIKTILAEWRAERKKRGTAYVPAALKYNSVDSPSPADLQLVELQRQAGLEMANALGVDPEELGISTTSRTYFNATDRRQHRVNDVLSPYMLAITQRLSMGDVTRRGYRVAWDLDGYMRTDPLTRVQYYREMKALGAITTEEIRVKESMPPMAKVEPTPAPAAGADASRDVDAAFEELTATFDGDRPLHFAAVPVQQFAVDRPKRTIEGLALPYGVVGNKGGLKFKFVKGSLTWSSVNRVKLLRDHDMSNPLGVAVGLTNMAAGVKVKFKVARGAEGDRALELAEDGVLDGLSVGVDFDTSTDVEMDPSDEGVMLVRRADLREVSLTAMPAFDDARVTKVAASRTEGTAMEDCATCGQRHAPGVACPTTQATGGLTLTADQFATLLASRPAPATPAILQAGETVTPAGGLTLTADQVQVLIRSGGMGALLGQAPAAPATTDQSGQGDQRQFVDPTRRTGAMATTVTREALPYQFDRGGNLTRGAQYDFSADLIAGSRGDGEAMGRAQAFIGAMAPVFNRETFADTDMADAAALNPNINRPDMYVDQKDFSYPIWDSINKGTLANATPFVLPKFSSSSGLVAAHVEAVEPTSGTVAATSQTITPTALSGKTEVTRMAWDQGGNPQLSGIIWRQMVRAWYEALEAAAVTLLDGLSPTGITLSTAAQDDVLVGEFETAIAALQFVRGGMRMRDLFLQIDLYKALINAKDADGRKLLPLLGAINANGMVSELFADVNIGGLRGRPAWALAATGTVAASSYLFDRNDVHGWASAPQRLEFEYRVAYVDIAVWGYLATANTDVTGVREVIYDPA